MSEPSQRKEDQARAVGRGALAIGFAKLYFIFTGLFVQFGLPRLLKWVLMRDGMSLDAATPAAQALYGDYKLVNNTVSQLNNTVVTGTIQTVSKFTAERENGLGTVKRRALVLQLCVGGGLSLAYALSASFLASLQLGQEDATEHHQGLTTAMRISALIVLAYSFYALFIGVLNGQRRFLAQATFDMSYSTLRPAAILGAAAAGLGVLGIFGAFATAAILICLAAAFVVGPLSGPRDEGLSLAEIAKAGVSIFVYTLLFNLLLFEDAQLLRPLVAYGAEGAQDLVTTLGRLSGIYGAVQNIGFVPYQLVIAVTFVVFPLVSKATFEKDVAATQLYIANAIRYSVILLAILLGALAAAPRGLVVLPHGAEYAEGGAALRALVFGQFCFSLLAVSNTILIGANRYRLAAESVLIALLVQGVAAFFLVPAAAKTGDLLQAPLVAAATAASIGISLGLARALFALKKEFQAILPLATLARGVVLLAACIALGVFFPEGGAISTLSHGILGAAVVIIGFSATKEFNAEDKARLNKVLRRKA